MVFFFSNVILHIVLMGLQELPSCNKEAMFLISVAAVCLVVQTLCLACLEKVLVSGRIYQAAKPSWSTASCQRETDHCATERRWYVHYLF